MIGNLISAGTGLLSGLFNGPKKQDKYNAKSQQRQYEYQSALNAQAQKYNMETMAQENRYAVENWLMQQEYNSPENQLKRVQEAGLNPNLVMGQSNVTNASNSAPSTPSGNSPSGGSADAMPTDISRLNPIQRAFEGAVQGLQTSLQYQNISQDISNKRAVQANTEADTRKKLQETLEGQQRTYSIMLDNYKKHFENTKLAEQYFIKLEQQKADIDRTYAALENLQENSVFTRNNADLVISQKKETDKKAVKLDSEIALNTIRAAMEKEMLDYYRRNGWTPNENMMQRLMSLGANALSKVAKGEVPKNLPEPIKAAAIGVINQNKLIQNGYRPSMY